MTSFKIDVWTDVVCPWCLVGSERLDQAIARLPAGTVVDVENHPFYLDPDTPPEGYDVAEMLRTKYGRDPREMQARVEDEAKKAGLDLDLSKQPRSYPDQEGAHADPARAATRAPSTRSPMPLRRPTSSSTG